MVNQTTNFTEEITAPDIYTQERVKRRKQEESERILMETGRAETGRLCVTHYKTTYE